MITVAMDQLRPVAIVKWVHVATVSVSSSVDYLSCLSLFLKYQGKNLLSNSFLLETFDEYFHAAYYSHHCDPSAKGFANTVALTYTG
jgi:hypothetical protein